MLKIRLYLKAFIILVTFIGFCNIAYADSFGALTKTLKKGDWVMSVEGYGAIDRDLKYPNGEVDSIYWSLFHGRGYGLTDKINIFGKIGYHNLKVDPNPFRNEEESLRGGLTGGLYLKNALFKEPENLFEVGIGGGFLYCSAHHVDGPKYDWREWQIGTYVSKEFGSFSPYVGLKYSDIDSKLKFKQKEIDLRGGSIEVESEDKLGAFVGINTYVSKDRNIYFNCEVNFISSFEIGAGLYFEL